MPHTRVTSPSSVQSLAEAHRKSALEGEVWASFFPFIEGEQTGGTGLPRMVLNPATGDPVARIVCAGRDEIDLAVESAASAWAMWKASSFADRNRLLLRLAALVKEQSEGIAALIALEQGKPLLESLTLEILPALDHLKFFAGHAERIFAGGGVEPREPLYAHKKAYCLNEPLGVVALITPSSLPFGLPLIQIGAALAMGNAVVLKPSEVTPLSALRIGELCTEAGFPRGLVNVIALPPKETLYLAAHPLVDKVFVTGKVETGQYVMEAAGCTPRPVVLSLSGKHPSIVAADADLERAVNGVVWGAMANAGQNCGSIERVYVEDSVARSFVDRVLAKVDSLRMGDPLGTETDLGPLVSEERRERVHAQVMEAVACGTRLARGGVVPNGPGFFYPPTVMLNPPSDTPLLREETLGPVLPITVVDSIERALMLANDSDYSLTASGWTKSPATAERLMAGLRACVVTVNDVLYAFGEPAASWSGYRRSGVGHTHGAAGLREMCRQRFVSFDAPTVAAPLFAYPYDAKAHAMARACLSALHAPRRFGRLAGVFSLVSQQRFRSRVPWKSFLGSWKRRRR